MGYHRAGFDVTGVDIRHQPHYPFAFHEGDALAFLEEHGSEYDVVHASPPCQAFTQMSAKYRGKGGKADSHPDLLTPSRALLKGRQRPWIIENVQGAKHHMQATITLHGGMFGLGVHRPRLFESNVLLMGFYAPRAPYPVGVYGTRPDGRTTYRYRNNGNMKGKSLIRAAKSIEEAREVMGIDWMDWAEIKEAIPPSYTEFVGRQLMTFLRAALLGAARSVRVSTEPWADQMAAIWSSS
jgi:DNA (cytosine-5)-methyltransferase 1